MGKKLQNCILRSRLEKNGSKGLKWVIKAKRRISLH